MNRRECLARLLTAPVVAAVALRRDDTALLEHQIRAGYVRPGTYVFRGAVDPAGAKFVMEHCTVHFAKSAQIQMWRAGHGSRICHCTFIGSRW